jgi:general secretion pathway protein J
MSSNRHGFTLLELLLAMTVLAVVVAMFSLSLSGSIRVFEGTEEEEKIYTMAQTAMDRITEDLAGAFATQECSFEGESGLENGHRADTLQFCSLAHVVFNPKQQKDGPALIRYRVELNEDLDESYRLLRSDQLLLPEQEGDGESKAPGFILADNLRSLQLTYFDSSGQEFDNWQGTEEEQQKDREQGEEAVGRLPAAVHCILEFWKDAEHTSTVLFSTRVVVPVGVGSER